MDAQGKRHNACMPGRQARMASIAHSLTLRVWCVLHSFGIPPIHCFTCAEHGR